MAINSKIPTRGSQPRKDAEVSKNFQEIANKFITNVIKDENGVRRIIFGKLPDGTYGLVISNDGTDVLDVFS
jgi:hypothetical protein